MPHILEIIPLNRIQLEIVCGNIESVIAAQQGGADRIELCDNLSEGGTTPSYGMIGLARKVLFIRFHVLIRPRGGDFLYSADEFEIMRRDIEICKHLRVDGIVTGILNADGSIDKKRTAELVGLAHPLPVTFHRAFDMTNNPIKALEDVIDCGCKKILTSGQQPSAAEGAELISILVKLAGGRISILPGGGIRPENAKLLIEKTGVSEIHSSAKTSRQSQMDFKVEKVGMGSSSNDEYQVSIVDGEVVGKLKSIIDSI